MAYVYTHGIRATDDEEHDGQEAPRVNPLWTRGQTSGKRARVRHAHVSASHTAVAHWMAAGSARRATFRCVPGSREKMDQAKYGVCLSTSEAETETEKEKGLASEVCKATWTRSMRSSWVKDSEKGIPRYVCSAKAAPVLMTRLGWWNPGWRGMARRDVSGRCTGTGQADCEQCGPRRLGYDVQAAISDRTTNQKHMIAARV
ncbi:hypothetical protein DFH11DRAFT_1545676 [Phellopilus nigrolimitatus]|nr:hypothetical protein DFH11DRAFT_1545676 [Phellopilus nigrolimitatus]